MAWRIYTTYESTKTTDWSYLIVTTALQSHLELWLGILAANLPMMGHLIKAWSPIIRSTFRKLKSGGGHFTDDSWSTQPSSSSWKISRKSKKTFEAMNEDSATLPLRKTPVTGTTTIADVELGLLPRRNKVNENNQNQIWRGVDFHVDSLSREEHHDTASPLEQRQARSHWS